jgi:hypothetical protein
MAGPQRRLALTGQDEPFVDYCRERLVSRTRSSWVTALFELVELGHDRSYGRTPHRKGVLGGEVVVGGGCADRGSITAALTSKAASSAALSLPFARLTSPRHTMTSDLVRVIRVGGGSDAASGEQWTPCHRLVRPSPQDSPAAGTACSLRSGWAAGVGSTKKS